MRLSTDGTILAASGKGFVNAYELFDEDEVDELTGRPNKVWKQLGETLKDEDGAEDDIASSFGKAIALSTDGSILAVAGVNEKGLHSVYYVDMFDFEADSWKRLQRISGLEGGDGFGEDLDLSWDGKTMAVGAPGSDENGAASGHIRIFELE